MKVSVIIPIYKPDFWFDECIESIANQTMDKTEYEVVLILNGDLSYRDYVQSVIDKYLKENIYQYFETDFGNVSNARNIGLDNARGEYIIFVDSDDVVSNDFVKGLLYCSLSNKIGVCRTEFFIDNLFDSYKKISVEKREKALIKYKSVFRNNKCLSGPCGKCMHKNIIGKERFNIKFSLWEDVLFWLAISHNIKCFELTNVEAVYFVRESRMNSLSRKKYDKSVVLKMIFLRNLETIRLFLRHPIKNNFLLFVMKLLSSINTGLKMFLK